MGRGFAWLESWLIPFPLLLHCNCEIPPQGPLYISLRFGVHSGVKLCRASEWKHREGVGSLHDPAKEFYQWKRRLQKRRSLVYKLPEISEWDFISCLRAEAARHNL